MHCMYLYEYLVLLFTCPGAICGKAANVGIVLTEHVLTPGVQSLDGHLAGNQFAEQINVNVPLIEPLH